MEGITRYSWRTRRTLDSRTLWPGGSPLSYMNAGSVRVRIGQHVSEGVQTNAAVPQGTLVGPVSFLLHRNGLHTTTNCVKYV